MIRGFQYWFDNPVLESVQLAAEHYEKTFGKIPDIILVSPKTLENEERAEQYKDLPDDLPYGVRTFAQLPALHYWAITDMGVESLGGK
jgi:hypothetical protein